MNGSDNHFNFDVYYIAHALPFKMSTEKKYICIELFNTINLY